MGIASLNPSYEVSDVIPGVLALASATRNPGGVRGLDSRFHGNDG